jgi:iron complex transport system substrate-binding protein
MKRKSKYRPIPSRAFLKLIWCLLVCLVPAESLAEGQITIQDDLGRTVRLERPARRIIALYGAFNEILGAMGLEDRIVARTQADRLPPSILDKPCIGTHMRPNVELVLSFKPDLVLQMAGRQQASESVTALKRLGVTTAFFKAVTFQDLFSMIERLGRLTGAEKDAQALITNMKDRLDAVQRNIGKPENPPLVFFEVRYPNLLAAGSDSMVNDIIQTAGGKNCVEIEKKLVRLGEEELLRLNPEVYLIQKGPMNPAPLPMAERPHYQTIQAVRLGRVFIVDEQEFSRPGPRNIKAVETLAEWLHPQAFSEMEVRPEMTKEKQ